MVAISPCMKAHGTLDPERGHFSPLGQYTSLPLAAPWLLILSLEQGKQNLWLGTEGHWTKWVSSSLSLQIVHFRGGADAATPSPLVVVVVVADAPLAVVVGLASPSTETPEAGRADDWDFFPTAAIPLGEWRAADPGRLFPLTALSAIPFLGEPGGKLSATDIKAAIGEGPFDCTATTAPSGGLTVRLPSGDTVLVTDVGTELTVLKAAFMLELVA